jgi:hypothetical protein
MSDLLGATMGRPKGGKLSIIIPVYNEEENIERAYKAITETLGAGASAYELGLLFGVWMIFCTGYRLAHNMLLSGGFRTRLISTCKNLEVTPRGAHSCSKSVHYLADKAAGPQRVLIAVGMR